MSEPLFEVDETGEDLTRAQTATGAELSPFQTPVKAYQSLNHSPDSDADPSKIATFLVRKPDSVERNEWVELGVSARKKLVKGIEIWRKKEAKEAKEGERLAKEKRRVEAPCTRE